MMSVTLTMGHGKMALSGYLVTRSITSGLLTDVTMRMVTLAVYC